MDAKNIYDAFVEIERLHTLIDKYHQELKTKKVLIENLRAYNTQLLAKIFELEERLKNNEDKS